MTLVKTVVPDSPIIDSRPFSYDPMTGIRTIFHYHEDGKVSFEKIMDAEALLNANQDHFNAAPESWKGELHKVASIPMHIYMDLKERGIVDDQKALKKWLNDRDNLKWRTKAGVV